ncbi:hypothetical protein G3576_05740 [Roseomonas stagni]|uniref:Uncharacterized protein n=1 Tax=Falsiroseomonas algicola TaxID=2716930 RepID=A0A6M1LGQ7_9PROT|nr:hypothetical protein [Falsiroseomonas algicola]NGM19506.1 hypothetical protein [Falsiroseomonas algicola]
MPEIRGFIDGLTGNQIDGWAFEPAHPTERVIVELRLDGQAVATTVADRHRTDLVRAGIGDAFHGFRFPLKPAWAERRSELSVVARGAEGGETPLQLFRRPPPPEARAAAPAVPPPASPQVIKAIEQLVAGQRALEQRLQEVAARAPAEATATMPEDAEQRIAVLEAWVARLDERLAALQAETPAPRAGRSGPDTWQVVLMALLGLTSFGALTAFALILAL